MLANHFLELFLIIYQRRIRQSSFKVMPVFLRGSQTNSNIYFQQKDGVKKEKKKSTAMTTITVDSKNMEKRGSAAAKATAARLRFKPCPVFSKCFAYRCLNFSIRPAVSISFCLPVKKGWQAEQISTLISVMTEPSSTSLPQAHKAFMWLIFRMYIIFHNSSFLQNTAIRCLIYFGRCQLRAKNGASQNINELLYPNPARLQDKTVTIAGRFLSFCRSPAVPGDPNGAGFSRRKPGKACGTSGESLSRSSNRENPCLISGLSACRGENPCNRRDSSN
jgi:hypothetical protein